MIQTLISQDTLCSGVFSLHAARTRGKGWINERGGGGDERRFNAYILYITDVPPQTELFQPWKRSESRRARVSLHQRHKSNDFLFSLSLAPFFFMIRLKRSCRSCANCGRRCVFVTGWWTTRETCDTLVLRGEKVSGWRWHGNAQNPSTTRRHRSSVSTWRRIKKVPSTIGVCETAVGSLAISVPINKTQRRLIERDGSRNGNWF